MKYFYRDEVTAIVNPVAKAKSKAVAKLRDFITRQTKAVASDEKFAQSIIERANARRDSIVVAETETQKLG